MLCYGKNCNKVMEIEKMYRVEETDVDDEGEEIVDRVDYLCPKCYKGAGVEEDDEIPQEE